MKKIVLGFIAIICAGCASTNNQVVKVNEEVTPNAGKISIVTHSDLIGTWGMDIPSNKQCIEYYNFKSENDVVINSAKEWSIGQYQYQAPSNRSDQLPAMVMQIKYDNNEKDCSGVQVDQTGELQQFFIKWVTDQQIQFCATNKGDNCFATLNKVLP